MIRRIITVIWGLIVFSFSIAIGGEVGLSSSPAGIGLYRVMIGSEDEAETLASLNTNAVLKISGGYLVLADESQSARIKSAGLSCDLIADNINRGQLAIDLRHDQANHERYPIVYQEGELCLYQIDPSRIQVENGLPDLAPLPGGNPRIFYGSAGAAAAQLPSERLNIDLTSVVELISQDSLESYSYWLEDMHGRPSGTNEGIAEILAARFSEFGYDSIYIDDFWGRTYSSNHSVNGWNVVVTKPGILYHADQIIIGAHLDAVPTSPGADDNGSGVAAVMEIARVLQNIETNLTIIFILFDDEEVGLLGSHDYAGKALERYDRIVFMLNMDMISFYRNSADVKIYHGDDTTYAAIWAHLADSLPSIGLYGHLSGHIINSDHYSFEQLGYPVLYAHGFAISTVYHSARDSTTHMNFDYFTRVTMASLATACYVDNIYVPNPTLLLSCPGGPPTIFMPGSEDTLRIKIEEYAGGVLDPAGVEMINVINGGTPTSVPMIDCGGSIYAAPFPAIECGDKLEYYVMAPEVYLGVLHYYPINESAIRALKASQVTTILDDNFNTDKGWTVTGNATAGYWERCIASGNYSVPRYDFDASRYCYVTDPSALCDVDNGVVALISPTFEIAPGDAYIEYARWFSNNLNGSFKEDLFKVYLYNGNQPQIVEAVGPYEQTDGGWYQHSLWVSDVFDPQLPIKLRFDACDLNYDSEVEAAVDAVKIIHYSYAPDILTGSISDAIFGDAINVQFDGICCHDPIIWSDRDGSLEGTGLTLSSDGLLSGVPSDTGVISFTALATDAEGTANEKAYSFHVWKTFVCGDAGMDYELNVGDAVYLINFVFKGGPAPYPLCVGDANGDNETNVGDAVYLINFIFKSGPAPMEGCCADLN